MTIGQKIRESRKKRGMNLEALAAFCGKKKSWLSAAENNAFRGDIGPADLIKIADALDDQSILTHALLANPICERIIPRAFKPLNNIKTEVSAMLAVLKEESAEMSESVEMLARCFTHKNPESQPMFRETLFAKLEQIKDVMRGGEELLAHLKDIGILSDTDLLELHLRQQAKCEAHGHHVPEMEVV